MLGHPGRESNLRPPGGAWELSGQRAGVGVSWVCCASCRRAGKGRRTTVDDPGGQWAVGTVDTGDQSLEGGGKGGKGGRWKVPWWKLEKQ